MTERTCAACSAVFSQLKGPGAPRRYCYTCLPKLGDIPRNEYHRLSNQLSDMYGRRPHVSKLRWCIECDGVIVNRLGPSARRCGKCRVALNRCRQCNAPCDLTYCSDTCKNRYAWRKRQARIGDDSPRIGECRWCWKPLQPGLSKSCSPECAQKLNSHVKTHQVWDRCHIPTCLQCLEMCPMSPGRYFANGRRCQRCADAAMRRSKVDQNAHKNNARRDAGKLALTVADIAQRDGNRCHLCRKPIDLDISGRHAEGPTIDHLIPVSHGGRSDDPANLALAHRLCNMSRGNRGPAQLRLVG